MLSGILRGTAGVHLLKRMSVAFMRMIPKAPSTYLNLSARGARTSVRDFKTDSSRIFFLGFGKFRRRLSRIAADNKIGLDKRESRRTLQRRQLWNAMPIFSQKCLARGYPAMTRRYKWLQISRYVCRQFRRTIYSYFAQLHFYLHLPKMAQA